MQVTAQSGFCVKVVRVVLEMLRFCMYRATLPCSSLPPRLYWESLLTSSVLINYRCFLFQLQISEIQLFLFNSGPMYSDCVMVGYLVIPQKITVSIYKYLLTT